MLPCIHFLFTLCHFLQVLGKKDIPAQLVAGSPDVAQEREHDHFQQLPVGSASQPLQQQYLLQESRQGTTKILLLTFDSCSKRDHLTDIVFVILFLIFQREQHHQTM